MKQNRYAILILAAALLAAVACRQEGSGSARATLVNPSVVEFAAKGAPETVVGVAADGAWSLRECPDWIKVSPTEGTGRADIVVSVSDNMENGEVALPRSGVVVFGGDKLLSRATLTVSQGGDRYAGTPASTLAQVPSLPDGSRAHVKNAQAVAATASAVLISDGTGFALTDGALKPGETATVKGVKGFEKGLVRLTDVDLLDVVAGTAPAPSATAVEDLDSFAGEGAFVTVTGVVGTANGAGDVALSVPGATRGVTVLSAPASLGFSAIAHHLAAVTGYAFVDGNTVCLVATDVEDKGAAMASDLLARWLFNDLTRDKLGPLFTGKAEPDGSNIYKSDNVKEEGDDGKYVPSEEGAGRLTYWSVDKHEIDSKNYFNRLIGKTGEPYVTGAYRGDYWEFSVALEKTYKAGSTVHFFAIPRSSNGSLKYWTLEILDGGEWKPMLDLLEKEVDIDAEGTKGVISYNCEQVGDGYLDVDANYVLTAELSGTLRIRYRSMANMTASATASKYKAVPDGGTHRFAGNTRTSPFIEIAYEL